MICDLYNWLLSLSIMFSRLFVACIGTFLFMTNYLYRMIYYILFSHLAIDGHLGVSTFWILQIMLL